MAKRNENGLTDKWQVFADEYRTDPARNAARAYKKAYPKTTQRTAEVNGSELLKKTEVSAYLEKKMKVSFDKVDVTEERIIKELARIAFMDIRQIFNDAGQLKDITEIDEDVARAISSVEVVQIKTSEDEPEQYVHKIKTNDKLKALELLGKYLKMFTDKVEHDTSQGGFIAIPMPANMSVDTWRKRYDEGKQ